MRVFTMAETSMSSEWDREWDDGELNVTSLGSMTWGYRERGNASVMNCKVCRVHKVTNRRVDVIQDVVVPLVMAVSYCISLRSIAVPSSPYHW